MVQYEELTHQQLQQYLPQPKTHKYEEILTKLASGSAVRIPAQAKELRGIRISIGREAKKRSITLEFITTEDAVVIYAAKRKVASTPQPGQKRRGRPPKNRQLPLQEITDSPITEGLQTTADVPST